MFFKSIANAGPAADVRLRARPNHQSKGETMHATLLPLALLCLAAAEKPTEKAVRAKPKPIPAKGATFEAIIGDLDEGEGDEAINLDGPQQFSLPDMDGWSHQQRQDWIVANKIDLLADYAKSRWALATVDVTLKVIPASKWGTVASAELDRVLSKTTPSAQDDVEVLERGGVCYHILKRDATVPVTFAFKTSEGNRGVLQIVEFREKPRGLKIRYKPEQPTQASRPETGSTRGTFLFVRTEPAGAEVLVDGQLVGTSDDLFRVEPGVRTIIINLDGHDPEDEKVTIRAGRVKRLELKLTKGLGSLHKMATADPSEVKLTKSQLPVIEMGLKAYLLDTGDYPTTEQGLGVLIRRPDDMPNSTWKGPYVNSTAIPRDAWENPIRYEYMAGDQSPRIWSVGPDGTSGTGDDITVGETSSGQGARATFGPVVQRTFTPEIPRMGTFVDLESGKTFQVPEEVKKDSSGKKLIAWAREKKVDINVRVMPGPICYLSSLDSYFWRTDETNWQKTAANDVLTDRELQGGELGYGNITKRPDELPAVYMFKTRECNGGLLEIVEFDESAADAVGVKIRFKLIRIP